MNRLALKVLAVLMLMGTMNSAQAAEKTRVGLFVDKWKVTRSYTGRSVAVKEIKQTLEEKGFEVGIFGKNEANSGKIYDYDVLYFGGGWCCYNWIDIKGRMHLVEYVQKRGGGVIFSMFRTGWAARSGIRPTFPEIAQAYNKSNGSCIIVTDKNHPITKGLPEKFMTPFWDHAVLRLGAEGRVLAVDTNNDISIACGNVGKGKVVFLGPWIGLNGYGKEVYPLPPNDEKLLLNSIGWVTANRPSPQPSPARGEGDKVKGISEEVKLKVLRHEKILDWTHNERGVSWHVGVLTAAMYSIEEKLDSLLIRAKRLSPFVDDIKTSKQLLRLQEKLTGLKNQLANNYEQAKRRKIDEIMKMSAAELEKEPVRDIRTIRQYNKVIAKIDPERNKRLSEQLLFSHLVKPVEEEVNLLENQLAGRIKKADEERAATERRRDAGLVPHLVKQLKSKDSRVREQAALELGRIGDNRTAKALISILKDKEYPVRRNAIYALGWMQSKKAVPALLGLAETTKDILTKRRAVQALGLIGDDRAVDFLISALKDTDYFVRQNAILSLGWLGDKKAVEPLIGILRQSSFTDEWSRENAVCVIRALGHIGDKNARLPLKEFLETHKGEKFGRFMPALGIDQAVDIALNRIEEGGRKEKGVQQPDFLKEKKDFYWLTGRYNALYGRYFIWKSRPYDVKMMADYAASNGGTGLIQCRTPDAMEKRRPGQDEYMRYFSKLGLKSNPCWRMRGTLLDKAGFERDVLRWGKYSALGGFWAEEALYFDKELRSDERFRRYLLKKYTSKELTSFGIKDIVNLKCPQPDGTGKSGYSLKGARARKFLFAEYMEFLADGGVDIWQEAAEWLIALRKGTYLTFSLSSRYIKGGSTYISGYPRVNKVLGSGGPQSYSSHAYINNFHLDMHVDGESRPALGEFYAHQADTPARVERGFASSFLHGQCFFNFWWGHIFKHASVGSGGSGVWDKGRWEAAERQFQKGRAISEYLSPRETESPKIITQLYSGRTATLTYGRGSVDGFGGNSQTKSLRTFRYTQNQQAIWEALIQSHLPVDMTWLETQSPEKLARYKVAILSDARSLKKDEVDWIRDWVKNGGVLIATGGTSLHDDWDRPLSNYALADVFGADYIKTAVTGPKDNLYMPIYRDLKPTEGIGKIMIRDKKYMEFMEGCKEAEYEKRIGYDVIKPITGRVVGVWEDGTPAVIENLYGRGVCIFLSPLYAGLSHTTGGYTVDELYKDYWEGSRELIAGCVKMGLESASTKLPVEVKNCHKRIEVALKKQEHKNRWMVHLLNMDTKINLVRDVEAAVNLAGKSVKNVYYPYPDKQEVKYVVEGDTLKFKVRDFSVHEMVVVEYK